MSYLAQRLLHGAGVVLRVSVNLLGDWLRDALDPRR
jgi:ABC-type dipeptide/oligopeptide/nickel transport system permease subunit